MNRLKGITLAAISSATFGMTPFFSVWLMHAGLSEFEVLTYRWGVACISLLLFGLLTHVNFSHLFKRTGLYIPSYPFACNHLTLTHYRIRQYCKRYSRHHSFYVSFSSRREYVAFLQRTAITLFLYCIAPICHWSLYAFIWR